VGLRGLSEFERRAALVAHDFRHGLQLAGHGVAGGGPLIAHEDGAGSEHRDPGDDQDDPAQFLADRLILKPGGEVHFPVLTIVAAFSSLALTVWPAFSAASGFTSIRGFSFSMRMLVTPPDRAEPSS